MPISLFCSPHQPDAKVSQLLSDLQQEVEKFVLRMSSVISGKKRQLVFLINNYELVLTLIAEVTHADSRESDSFKDLLATRLGWGYTTSTSYLIEMV